MAKFTSRFFTTKNRKADDYYRAGLSLFLRGRTTPSQCIGFIRQDKETGLFYVSVVNSNDVLADGEFKTFAEADAFGWTNATSSARKAA